MENKSKNKKYRIGFDIGVGSVGWAVIENDPVTDEPCKIIKLGVRTFSPNEVEKTGESTAKNRRLARGVRRRRRRKQNRMVAMTKLVNKTLQIDAKKELASLINTDVYKLRSEALDKKVTDGDLAKIIFNILNHRGFKSNRKNMASKDEGKLISAIAANKKLLADGGYRTFGEMVYKSDNFKIESCGQKIYLVRNHGGDYRNCFDRDGLVSELKQILNAQQQLGNSKITQDFIDKVVFIVEKQRNFDEGPGKGSPYSAKFEIGNCTFLPSELRAPKDSFTFEYFDALSKLNSLRISGEPLTDDQRAMVLEIINTKGKLSFYKMRQMFNLKLSSTFNLCRYSAKSKKDEDLTEDAFIKSCEQRDFVNLDSTLNISKALGAKSFVENGDLIDEIAFMLCTNKSDERIDTYMASSPILCKLTDEQKNNIKALSCDKFGSLSIKAMKQIMPYLLQGLRYDEACKSAGFNHSSFAGKKSLFLEGPQIEAQIKEITSNVVKRAVNQMLRILNEIIKEYGSPQFVTIELARDLSRLPSERIKVQKDQLKNFEENELIKQKLRDEHNVLKPTGTDVLKYRLYNEQDGKCMYSGKRIEIERLFEPNYVQIDHIIPISRSLNDSYNNKVLVIAAENQNKGDRIPYEWFGDDEKRWSEFVARAALIKNKEKRHLLTKQKYTEEEQKEFISRNINDTRYMSKFLLELLEKNLLLAPTHNGYKKVVRSVNGAVTNYLRRCWGIEKLREDGDIHHAVDAAVIATATESQIQKITKFNKLKEKFECHGDKFISKKTGEVMSVQEKEDLELDEIKNKLANRLPMPYEGFDKELSIRSKIDYTSFEFSAEDKAELIKLGYDADEVDFIKPVFISRMKTIKTTGSIHAETFLSAREYKETGMLIKSVPIQNLKVVDVPEDPEHPLAGDKHPEKSIAEYYRPADDRLLYLALKEYLIANGNNIPNNVEFHKPKADGTPGPIVKKVKQYVKSSKCVITPHGAAANDIMHRVDVFEKGGKYYLCPVYMADVYAKKLPNKVIAINKPWITIDKSFNFKFSLYQNDLIKVSHKTGITLTKNFQNPKSKKPDSITNNEFLLYYNSTGISGATIKLKTHDNCYGISSCGIKTLAGLEKYYVDIMGKIYKAPPEKRKGL